jgi:Fur family transcriptional regulator, zinc uptake regulator
MPITPLASRPHDHSHCVHSALSGGRYLCAQKGLRLTALRRRVLELVWQSHKPLGAYDILAVLSEQDGRRAAPPDRVPSAGLPAGKWPGAPHLIV